MESTAANSVDELIRVDSAGNELGFIDKEAAHDGAGVLHRAFSVFLVNTSGEILIQQRSPQKRLWPGFWSNSVCSHPRRGEQSSEAARRRISEELRVAPPHTLRFLYQFEYQASFQDAGSEHELCQVYWGELRDAPNPDPAEISAIEFVSPDTLNERLAQDSSNFTPWFLLEWDRIQREFREVLPQA